MEVSAAFKPPYRAAAGSVAFKPYLAFPPSVTPNPSFKRTASPPLNSNVSALARECGNIIHQSAGCLGGFVRAARPSAVSARMKRVEAHAVAAFRPGRSRLEGEPSAGIHRRFRALSGFEWAVRPSAAGARSRRLQANASRALSSGHSGRAGPAPKRSAGLQVGSGASFVRAAAVVALRHCSLRAGSSQLGRFKSKTREAGAKANNRTQCRLQGRSAG